MILRCIHSTPLRLTLVLIAVFSIFLAMGLGTAYGLMRRTLSDDLEARAEQAIDELQAIDEADDRLERAQEIIEAADTEHLLLRVTSDGETVANFPREDLEEGPVYGHRTGLHDDVAESYLVEKGRLTDGEVTVLVSRESLAELNEIFLAILLFSFIPALLLTSGIGWIAVRRTAARVGRIREALHALAGGNLGARVGGPHPATDLGDIGRDIDRMAEAQEAATEALRQIGSDIAHDLKTPIQRVAVRLERLSEAELSGNARAELEAVQGETALIIGTFQSLLQIAQLEGGQGREGFGLVDLTSLLSDMAEIYAPAVEESGATLTCEIAEGAPPVVGDRHLLSRLIANLLENALRHAPGAPIQIRLAGRELSLADAGPGIPETRREDVLRRLVRLEASRSTPGSGLGLAMVKAIADLHGARLTLQDGLGAAPEVSGLCVTIAFPDPSLGLNSGEIA